MAVDDVVYFAANDGVVGAELWRADTAGAVLVADLQPGLASSNPRPLLAWRGGVYFDAEFAPGQFGLFHMDDTGSNIARLAVLRVASAMFELGGKLYFTGGANFQNELWQTDGTPAGTFQVVDLRPGPLSSGAHSLIVAGGRLFFGANDGVHGYEIWMSDGTAAGTQIAVDLVPGSTGSRAEQFFPYAQQILFAATTPATGLELFTLDPVTLQAQLVFDVSPGSGGSDPWLWLESNGRLFFTAHSPSTGFEPWSTDGTPQGTVGVDIMPGLRSALAGYPASVSGGIVLAATSPAGRELWFTDGSPAGTRLVIDLAPGSSSNPTDLRRIAANDRLLFAADARDGRGVELFQTDGTPVGSGPLAEINPLGDGAPRDFVRSGRWVFFVADDGVAGEEPWILDLSVIGGAVADPYGTSCPATNGPQLTTNLPPTLGASGFALTLATSALQQPALLLLGTQRVAIPVAGFIQPCSLLVGGTTAHAVGTTDSAGQLSIPLTIPAIPSLLGAELAAQGAVADARVAGTGFALSEGLRMVLGG